jgi:hypothetical protein
MRFAAGLFAVPILFGVAVSFFEEVDPDQSGIVWTHDSGRSESRHLPESLGPGVAFLDYNNDGRLDVYLVNGGPTDFYKAKHPAGSALFRNEGGGKFANVSDAAGVSASSLYGLGAAAADYDNDGDIDLYVTGHGRALLYRNRGDGRFEEVGERAGVGARGLTTSAVWFDYDNDGLLDLFVCSFVRYTPEDWSRCGKDANGRSFYCIPRVFEPTPSLLYRNRGDGTFVLTSNGTAIEAARGKALGAVATDVNEDGWMDLFVANDTVQNFLFLNHGNAAVTRWEEAAVPAEVAYSTDGQPRSGMGVDSTDVDGDGREDLFVSNVDNEKFSLYRNNGEGSFSDVAHRNGVAQATRLLSGWGLKFFDYNLDGAPDLFLANGHPDDMVEQHRAGVQFKEPLLLFANVAGTFKNVSASAGPVFEKRLNARGLAIGDYDNDGRVDVLIGVNNSSPVLLRNTTGSGAHWVGLHLAGKLGNRDGVGARITWSSAAKKRSRLVVSGGSYLSSHDPRVVLGLGAAAELAWVEVQWPSPSKRVERFANLRVDAYNRVEEGNGKAVVRTR